MAAWYGLSGRASGPAVMCCVNGACPRWRSLRAGGPWPTSSFPTRVGTPILCNAWPPPWRNEASRCGSTRGASPTPRCSPRPCGRPSRGPTPSCSSSARTRWPPTSARRRSPTPGASRSASCPCCARRCPTRPCPKRSATATGSPSPRRTTSTPPSTGWSEPSTPTWPQPRSTPAGWSRPWSGTRRVATGASSSGAAN